MPFIQQISTSTPNEPIAQNAIAKFMVKAMRLNEEEERKLKAVFRLSGIESRHSVINDYSSEDDKSWAFYPAVHEQKAVQTESRMQLFEKEALPLSEKSLADIFEYNSPDSFTHLITVSCTGLFAPGLDVQLIKKHKMRPSIERTSIQFMGCFAAINALKTANHICKADVEAKVLIICVELCTIHFQETFNEDNLLANTIFGDGAAAVVVSSDTKNPLYSIEGFRSIVHGDSEEEMAWHIGNNGFQMKLSAYVPNIIESSISALTEELTKQYGILKQDIQHYAIHPGGKRILDAVEKGLNLDKSVNDIALSIFKKFGNMSSPTILFVLERLAAFTKKDENVLSFAFGPGLTMESMLLKCHG